jgi:hypothetical protein
VIVPMKCVNCIPLLAYNPHHEAGSWESKLGP